MPKWKDGATVFTVGVSFDERRGYAATVPKPVMEFLSKPERLTYVLKRGKVEVMGAEKG